ncbi:MAG: outer membrane protein assembly factor BamB [Motiliproteus sp.]|jgi:outer membrane protein assembly factor BamB
MLRLMRLLPLLLVLVMSGCGLWSTDQEIQPAELEEISAEYELKKLWSAQIGDGLGAKYQQLTPQVLASRIFAVDHQGSVYALERSTGELVWHQQLGLPVSGGVGVGSGRVVITSFDGQVVALSALDGAEVWRGQLTSEAVAPAQLASGLALIQTIDGRLSALDAQTGELRWSYSAQEPVLTLRGTSTPLLVDDVVYAGFSSGKVVAFALKTGEVIWESRVASSQGRTELERMVDVDGSMTYANGWLYAGSYQGRVSAIGVADGRSIWNEPLSSYRSLVQNAQLLFAVNNEGAVIAFDKQTGSEQWKQPALYYRQLSSPAVVGGVLAVGDYQGYIHLIDPVDGYFVGRYSAGSSPIVAAPLSEDGVLYTLSDNGRLSALVLQKN